MTRYLLRWQLVIMKRQLLTFQGLFPLLMGVALQILFIVLLSTHTSQPIVPYITAIVLYLTIFGIIQVTNSFVQVMLSSSSGLLGIAPVIPQAKVIMALVSLLIVAGLNVGILAGVPAFYWDYATALWVGCWWLWSCLSPYFFFSSV